MSHGACPNCRSTNYGQNPRTLEGNQCFSCGYTGPVRDFHQQPQFPAYDAPPDYDRPINPRPATAKPKHIAPPPVVSEPPKNIRRYWLDD